jgi:cytosine deaminase
MVDMHCDETDDPMSRHIEQLAYETQRLGLQGRVAGSHLTSMHSMDNYYVSKLLPLMAEAEVAAIPNPLINITHAGPPRHLPEAARPDPRAGNARPRHHRRLRPGLRARPVVSARHGDMLDVAFMGLHVAQMTSPADMRKCFDMVTTETAKIMGLSDLGLEKGKRASLVVLDAGNPVEAIRLRPDRLLVMSHGKIVARRAQRQSALSLPGRPESVSRRFQLPG